MLGAPQCSSAGSIDRCPDALRGFVHESLFPHRSPMAQPVRIEQCREPPVLMRGTARAACIPGEAGGNSLPLHASSVHTSSTTHDVPGANEVTTLTVVAIRYWPAASDLSPVHSSRPSGTRLSRRSRRSRSAHTQVSTDTPRQRSSPRADWRCRVVLRPA